LALAKGFGLGAGRPVVGIGTLEVLAAAAGAAGPGLYAPLVDARHQEVFTALFEASPEGAVQLSPIAAVRPERLGAWLAPLVPEGRTVVLVGPGLSLMGGAPLPGEAGPADPPRAPVLAALAARIAERGEAAGHPPEPLYGRSPEIFSSWSPPSRLASRPA
jgi:tRNA A37 threonylcarbamoyladenosine modification protein TsaB